MFEGGGLEEWEELREGDHDLVGEDCPGEYGMYGGASAVGGGMLGTLSSIDDECDRGSEEVEGW